MVQDGTSGHRLYRMAPIKKVLRWVSGAEVMTSPQDVVDFFAVCVCSLEHEMFEVLHLDAGNIGHLLRLATGESLPQSTTCWRAVKQCAKLAWTECGVTELSEHGRTPTHVLIMDDALSRDMPELLNAAALIGRCTATALAKAC